MRSFSVKYVYMLVGASQMALVGKNLPAMQEINARDAGLIPGLERSPGKENGNPLQKTA